MDYSYAFLIYTYTHIHKYALYIKTHKSAKRRVNKKGQFRKQRSSAPKGKHANDDDHT